MDNAPISSDIGRRAGVPWYYPVVFLLNILLILAAEVLLLYRQPVPMTEAILAEKLPAYHNASIQNSTESGTIVWYLVQTEADELHLIPVRKHILFQNRGKLLDSQITLIPADTGHMEVTTRAGIGGSTVMIGTEVEPWDGEQSEYNLQMRSKYAGGNIGNAGRYAASGYFLLGVLLSILEYVLWNKIKGNM